ncbi:MAG: RNA-guided endonuclease InsQ/TnpB family protein [Desulfococcaceae bacterium]
MKAIRIYISKPLNTDWKNTEKTLDDIQHQSAKALNYCMTKWYFWQQEKENWKSEKGKYPTFSELPSPEKMLYTEMRGMFPELQSKTISEINQKAKQRFSTDCREVFYSFEKSLPTFRKTHPVMVSGQQYSLEKKDGVYIFSPGLRPKDYKGIRKFDFALNTVKLTGSQKAVIDRIFSGEYKKSAAMISQHKRKRKWFVIFTYEPEKKTVLLDKEKILGVDLGISKAFFCGIKGEYDRISESGEEIKRFRQKIRHWRRSFQHSAKVSTRGGQGRNKILRPVLALGDKEKRFRDTKYHQYSKAIVEFALKHGCGVIQMENLDGLVASGRSGHFLIRDWAISDLHTKLKYKADEYGIELRFVNPKYTSQRCSECGFIDRENRTEQEKFKCLKCGFEENADYNAALNLSIANIDEIIKSEISGGNGE